MENSSQVSPAAQNISSSYFTTATVSSSTTASLNASRWLLDDTIEGPAIATLVGIEFALSLPSNLFILIYSLRHWKQSLDKSSTIFLFNLSLSNLMVSLFYMFFYMISTGAEEWIFGRTDHVRNILCQLHGFVFAFTTAVPLFTLAVISFDRFLSIVKPHLHKRILSCKVALVIVVILWLIAFLIGLFPFFGLGVGSYDWSRFLGGCLPRWDGNREYVILLSIFGCVLFMIISITSIWTFIFTGGFLRRNMMRHQQTLDTKNLEIQKHIYSERVRNLVGIFGMLLFFNLLTLSPFVIISMVTPIIGFDAVPAQVYVTVFILFLFNNVSNPFIQAYFRKDLWDTIKKYFMRVMSIFKRRNVEDQEAVAMSRTQTIHRSMETSVCEDVMVVEEGGEGKREVESPCNEKDVDSSHQLPVDVVLESTVTEKESVALTLYAEVKKIDEGEV